MNGKRLPQVQPMREIGYEVLAAFKLGPLTTSMVCQILPTQTQGRVKIYLRTCQKHVRVLTAAGLLQERFPSAVVGGNMKFLHELTSEGEKRLKEQDEAQRLRRQKRRYEQTELLRGPTDLKVKALKRVLKKRLRRIEAGVFWEDGLDSMILYFEIDGQRFGVRDEDIEALIVVMENSDKLEFLEELFGQFDELFPSLRHEHGSQSPGEESGPTAEAEVDPELQREEDLPLTLSRERDQADSDPAEDEGLSPLGETLLEALREVHVEAANESETASTEENSLVDFRLQIKSNSGKPIDLTIVDDTIGAHPAVRDLALVDYDGFKAVLKVWIDDKVTGPSEVAPAIALAEALAENLRPNQITVTVVPVGEEHPNFDPPTDSRSE
ncbi:MAG: hypothetical protein Q8P13_02350 [bacterium]|nr:hypothetical protein [bacterium]